MADETHEHRISHAGDRAVPLVGVLGGFLMLCLAVVGITLAVRMGSASLPLGGALIFQGDPKPFVENFGAQLGLDPRQAGHGLLYLSVLVGLAIYLFSFVYFTLRIAQLAFAEIARSIFTWMTPKADELEVGAVASPAAISKHLRLRQRFAHGFPEKHSAAVLLGREAQFIAPTAMPVAERLFMALRSSTKSLFKTAAVFGALCLAVVYLSGAEGHDTFGYLGLILRAIGTANAILSLAMVFGLRLVLLLLVKASEYLSLVFLRPPRVPSADAADASEGLMAASAPRMLQSQFEVAVRQGVPTKGLIRTYSITREEAAASVRDTGNFELEGLIETPQRLVTNPHRRAALFMLLAGWSFRLVGVVLLLLMALPSALRNALLDSAPAVPKMLLMPIAQIVVLLTGAQLLSFGVSFVQNAKALYKSRSYVNEAVSYRFQGSTSRAEVAVGGDQSSVIRSSAIVYRTEFLFEAFCCELYSEANTDGAERSGTAMRRTSQSDQILTYAMEKLRLIAAQRVAPVTVDMNSDAVKESVQANLSIEAARHGAIEEAKLAAQRRSELQTLQPPDHGALPGS